MNLHFPITAICKRNTSGAKKVERLQLPTTNEGKQRTHLDLCCTFDLPVNFKSNVVRFNRSDRDQRVQRRVFNSSATEAGLPLLTQIDKSQEKTTTKVPLQKPLPKPTDDDRTRAFPSTDGARIGSLNS